MTVTAAVLNTGQQLTASAASIYQSPALTKTKITRAVLANNDIATPYTVTIYKVPAAGTAGSTNVITNAVSVAAGATYIPNELANMILGPGESIWALASTTLKINMFMSGFQIT